MFKHSGKKLQRVAGILFLAGVVVSVALGIGLIARGSVSVLGLKLTGTATIAAGAAAIVVGAALSYLFGLVLYGFGELIVKTKDNNYLLSRIASHTKDALEQHNQQ